MDEEKNQTPEVEEEVNEETQDEGTSTDSPETEGTGENKKTPEVDYKEKFAQSSKEAQRLYESNKDLQAQLTQNKARQDELARKADEYDQRLKEEKPEEHDMVKLKEEINELKRETTQGKEERLADEFLSSNPQAARQKEALKALRAANPAKSYDEIWRENFQPLVEEKENAVKKETKKKNQVETGRESNAEEPVSTGKVPSDFNDLPLSEQKKYIQKELKGEIKMGNNT